MEDPLIAQALQLIGKLSQGPVTVGKIAQNLPTTRRTLERKFRGVLGCTVLEEINRCRLERAERLLQNTQLSIAEVVVAAGFPSIDRMGKAFQRVHRVSPRNYRRWKQ